MTMNRNGVMNLLILRRIIFDPVDLLAWRLFDHSRSRDFKRTSLRLVQLAEKEPQIKLWHPILFGILLIESRERSRTVRVFEWIIFWTHLRSHVTCGVFQMVNAPFRFEKAAREVVTRLSDYGCIPTCSEETLNPIAKVWNGAAEKQPGACIGYAKALNIAIQFRST